MMGWIRNTPADPLVMEHGGFKAGDLVRHKVSLDKGVVIRFDPEGSEGPGALLSRGFYANDEFWCRVAEIEIVPIGRPSIGDP